MPNVSKIFEMAIKYINIFQSKALENLPKLGFWFKNKPSGNPASSLRARKQKNDQFRCQYKTGYCDAILQLSR
jgi:hypothetical protein